MALSIASYDTFITVCLAVAARAGEIVASDLGIRYEPKKISLSSKRILPFVDGKNHTGQHAVSWIEHELRSY